MIATLLLEKSPSSESKNAPFAITSSDFIIVLF